MIPEWWGAIGILAAMALGGYCGWTLCFSQYHLARWREGFEHGLDMGRRHAQESLGAELGIARAQVAELQTRIAHQTHLKVAQRAAGTPGDCPPPAAKARWAALEAYWRSAAWSSFLACDKPPRGWSKH